MRQTAAVRPLARVTETWRRHPDLLIVGGITIVAAILRLWALESFPPGLHGDEALTGLDAQRIQSEGWIGPYVGSALGQPTGPLYWAALVLEFAGNSVYAVRLSMAVLGIATVPIAYFAVREMFDRRVALIATLLIAFMTWHLVYSRTAFMVISWPLMEVIVMGLLFAAFRLRHLWLFAAAGVALGAGIYSYNVYPLFVIVIGLFAGLVVLQSGREWQPLLLRFGLLFACAYVLALPLLSFAADDKNGYFNHHKIYSYLNSDEYKEADLTGRIDLLWGKTKLWLDQMLFEEHPDFVDGAGTRPMLDPLTIALVVGGIVIAGARFRRPEYQLLLLMLLIMPIASIVSQEGGFRRSLGLVPVVAILAALPLAYTWERAKDIEGREKLMKGAVAAALLGFAAINVYAYFGDIGRSDLDKWVFAQPIAEAAKYVDKQPDGTYVYFYSGRWSFNYETRQYLAPDARGEDRSKEFGKTQGFGVDRGRESLILLLPPYTDEADALRSMYPDAREVIERDGEETLFIAFHVPPLSAREASPR